MGLAMEGIENVKVPPENTNGLENKVRAYLSEKTGLNLGEGKAGNDGIELSTKGTGKTVDDLIKVAKPGRATKGRTIQYELSGGFSEAMNDFHSLGPKITKDTPDLKVGILKDGRTVIVRKRSSDGRPTLEIQNGKKRIKFRY